MPQYRLSYFDFSGSRGEDCRLAFVAAGVPFEDRRLKREEWAALKPSAPYGSLPLLEIEGKPLLAQSNAILMYIGHSYGLLPKDAWRAALHHAVLDAVEELRTALAPSGKFQDQEEKKRAREEFTAGPLRAWATRIEAQIQGPFLEADALSVADIKVCTMMNSFISGSIDFVPKDAFATFPRLTRLYEAVYAQPQIAAWRARH
jgi:prostaglandin-H2 D-isomerase / glutathione transferase